MKPPGRLDRVEVHHGVVKLASRIGDAKTRERAALDARRVMA